MNGTEKIKIRRFLKPENLLQGLSVIRNMFQNSNDMTTSNRSFLKESFVKSSLLFPYYLWNKILPISLWGKYSLPIRDLVLDLNKLKNGVTSSVIYMSFSCKLI